MADLNLAGQRFGRLTAISKTDKRRNRTVVWLCECDCGNTKEVSSVCLTNGFIKSCGCLRREKGSDHGRKMMTKHGWYGTRVYRVWHGMVCRCDEPSNSQYPNYGGRGIKVCDEWRNNPKAFCEWAMANGYSDNLTIDRIDVDGNYEPNNCRWVTIEKQQGNKRNNVNITYMGKTQCVAAWAREVGLNQMSIYERVRKGWADPEKILFGARGKERM